MASSMKGVLDDYFEKLMACKKVLGTKPKVTFEDHINFLTQNTGDLATMGFSDSLRKFMDTRLTNEQAKAFGMHAKWLKGSLGEDEMKTLMARWILWNYLDATIVICPSCKRPMQMNWGWCPYHPTMDEKSEGLLRLEDIVGSAPGWTDEFIGWLQKGNAKDVSIADYLKKVEAKSPTRIFVHCSEFLVAK